MAKSCANVISLFSIQQLPAETTAQKAEQYIQGNKLEIMNETTFPVGHVCVRENVKEREKGIVAYI